MAGSLTDYSETAWLNHLFRNTSYTPAATLYLVAYTVAPTDSSAGTECSNYTRPSISFAAASGRSITQSGSAAIVASGGAAGAIVALGISDASTGGNLLAFDDTDTGETIADGETLTVSSFAITIASGGLTTYACTNMLDRMFRNQAFTSPTTTYLGLFTADPSDAGGGTQSSQTSRTAVTFSAPSGGVVANSSQLDIAVAAAETHTAAGQWDASTSGNLLAYDTAFTEGDAPFGGAGTFQVSAGALTWAIS